MSEPTSLEFDGERYIPGTAGNIELEHLHRYLLARELCAGKNVLDVACGEGYGSSMIADKAHNVIGVDISDDAVAHAQATYSKDNLEYRVGDCTALPLPDDCVDVVVSFETIEHHDRHEAMLSEIRRVLKPDGVALISSPDKYYYSDLPGTRNLHHVKELYADEFKALMAAHFRHVRYYGQSVVYGSVILAENTPATQVSYHKDAGEVQVTEGLGKPLFWLAVASDGELPELLTGLFEQPIEESELVRMMQRDIDNACIMLSQKDAHLAHAADMLRQKDEHLAHAAEQLAKVKMLVAPLRWPARMFRLAKEWLAGSSKRR